MSCLWSKETVSLLYPVPWPSHNANFPYRMILTMLSDVDLDTLRPSIRMIQSSCFSPAKSAVDPDTERDNSIIYNSKFIMDFIHKCTI